MISPFSLHAISHAITLYTPAPLAIDFDIIAIDSY